jgi:hypothetical protein
MATYKPLYQEVIDEIGTQTLARFGLNIFSLNTYDAYGASVKATVVTNDTYNRHKNNKQYFGQTFEDLDVGLKNIKSGLLNQGNTTFTTDELADIKKVVDIQSSGKNIDNLNAKDRAKYEFVTQNYSEAIERLKSTPNMLNNANKNDTSTDTITFDKNGNIVEKSQHKAIKNTEGLLKDRYLENNDIFTVPYDDYVKHKDNLEEMLNNPNTDPQKREKATKALKMLNKNNLLNRTMSENPNATATAMQTATATAHIAQAGLSDAVIVALSTLANGIIWEVKDMYRGSSDTPIEERFQRLIDKVTKEFKDTFQRGASFGAIDVGIGILSQIFKSISSKLKQIWNSIRESAKSIYNAIYSYITGKITSFRELLSTIIKALLSAMLVVGTVALETQLETFLAPIISPTVASFVAPILAIVAGAFAVVVSMRGVDAILNTLFGVFAKRDIAKMKADEIEKLCNDMLPKLAEDRQELEKLIEDTYKDRKIALESSFEEVKSGIDNSCFDSMTLGLIKINSMYEKSLQFETFEEFDEHISSGSSFRL